ncbi:tRNA (adenosine(37)-N6)-dimethylallyltransferase MiaA [Candidatus Daviesbacteria bacterium]|nr:tRNA (adenosine(37)-N6)-dimethylallyltransferase MiaA [Candidatus Daviesbacteria bacterium]
MGKLLIILGPTSTGKTDLALYLAKRFDGEVISCDSRQVYMGLDLGTGKMPNKQVCCLRNKQLRVEKSKGRWEVEGVKIWQYDVVVPKKQYTVYDYIKDANKVIFGILNRRKLPIIAGGTGLYLKALLEGLPNLSIPIDQNLRKQLNDLKVKKLQQKLQDISPDKWNSLNISDRQNPRRLIRAIEIMINSKLKCQNSKLQFKSQNYNTLKIGLITDREILYQRSDKHVVGRIKLGMIEESENLHKNGLSLDRMKQLGLEYGVLADYLEGRIQTQDELIKVLQLKIHDYIRRQMTWFKKEKDVNWFDITDLNYLNKIEKLVRSWYDSF